MITNKLLSLLMAWAFTLGSVAAVSPVLARQKPVIVEAPRIPHDRPTRIVSYRDLDLASWEGEKILVKRVRGAVKDVCTEANDGAADLLVDLSCRRDSWKSAEPQVTRAVSRARELAARGFSTIPALAITITAK